MSPKRTSRRKHSTTTAFPHMTKGTPKSLSVWRLVRQSRSYNRTMSLYRRIVPHIRRAWVVGKQNGRRIIGSGEWIVFRSDRFYPPYLRQLLLGDWFHPEFMRTVSGVGGSLLRARPTNVARIKIPLPPMEEAARRIAAILDQAEALRAKRQPRLSPNSTLPHPIPLPRHVRRSVLNSNSSEAGKANRHSERRLRLSSFDSQLD